VATACCVSRSLVSEGWGPRTGNDDNDEEQDDDGADDAHAHLHVLPPHLLSYAVRSTSEALGGDGEVVGLVLQRVQAFAALGDFINIVAHDAYGAVDFLCHTISKGSISSAVHPKSFLAFSPRARVRFFMLTLCNHSYCY
jgi:hypothetical protein